MNMSNTQASIDHEDVVMILPWYVNESLDSVEQDRVRIHLRDCPACRRELRSLGRIGKTLQQEDAVAVAARASFRTLQQRLGRQSVLPVRTDSRRSGKRPMIRRQIVMFALAASLLLVAFPLMFTWQVEDMPAPYQTLADRSRESKQPSGQVRVVFAPDLTSRQIGLLLDSVGGQMVSGPNSVGAYSVRLSAQGADGNPSAAVAYLRGQSGVLLAEPIVQASAGEQP
jgi:hypothetical protein